MSIHLILDTLCMAVCPRIERFEAHKRTKGCEFDAVHFVTRRTWRLRRVSAGHNNRGQGFATYSAGDNIRGPGFAMNCAGDNIRGPGFAMDSARWSTQARNMMSITQ